MLSVTSEQVEIDIKEVYRYLGYGTDAPDERIAGTIGECIREVEAASQLRSFCRGFSFSRKGNADGDASFEGNADGDAPIANVSRIDAAAIEIGGIHIESSDLARHLGSCAYVYVFGATIGIGLDRLIARASISEMTKATIYQAVGAAYIEAYCDVINSELDRIAAAGGKGTRPRFSPGYGDFDITYQKDIFKLLDLTKHTGISLTEGMLMTPSKSVTAIVGVTCEGAAQTDPAGDPSQKESVEKGQRLRHNCEICDLEDCRFRRDDR